MDINNDKKIRRCMNDDVIRSIQSDLSFQEKLEKEFNQLTDDREEIRHIFANGDSKVSSTRMYGKLC